MTTAVMVGTMQIKRTIYDMSAVLSNVIRDQLRQCVRFLIGYIFGRRPKGKHGSSAPMVNTPLLTSKILYSETCKRHMDFENVTLIHL